MCSKVIAFWSFNGVDFTYTLFGLKMMLVELQLIQEDIDPQKLEKRFNRTVSLTRFSITIFLIYQLFYGIVQIYATTSSSLTPSITTAWIAIHSIYWIVRIALALIFWKTAYRFLDLLELKRALNTIFFGLFFTSDILLNTVLFANTCYSSYIITYEIEVPNWSKNRFYILGTAFFIYLFAKAIIIVVIMSTIMSLNASADESSFAADPSHLQVPFAPDSSTF